jgi:hypothetical protein
VKSFLSTTPNPPSHLIALEAVGPKAAGCQERQWYGL